MFYREFNYNGFASEIRADIESWRLRRLNVIITSDAMIRLLYPTDFPIRFTRCRRRNQLRLRGFFIYRFHAAMCLIRSNTSFHVHVVFYVRLFGAIIKRLATLFNGRDIAFTRHFGRIIGIESTSATCFYRFFCMNARFDQRFCYRYLVQAPNERRLSFGSTFANDSIVFR